MKAAPSPEAITEWLQRASGLSDLDSKRRLEAKIDMSPESVTARLREASDLLDLCVQLGALRSEAR